MIKLVDVFVAYLFVVYRKYLIADRLMCFKLQVYTTGFPLVLATWRSNTNGRTERPLEPAKQLQNG